MTNNEHNSSCTVAALGSSSRNNDQQERNLMTRMGKNDSNSANQRIMDLNRDLDLLARVTAGHTICVSSHDIIPHRSWKTSFWRRYTGESRDTLLIWLESVVVRMLEVSPSSVTTRSPIRRSTGVTNDVVAGLRSLIVTYQADDIMAGKLQDLIDRLVKDEAQNLERLPDVPIAKDLTVNDVPESLLAIDNHPSMEDREDTQIVDLPSSTGPRLGFLNKNDLQRLGWSRVLAPTLTKVIGAMPIWLRGDLRFVTEKPRGRVTNRYFRDRIEERQPDLS